jgi:hypothetical protein
MPCEICGQTFTFDLLDHDKSELEVVGFIGKNFATDKTDATPPRFTCESCFEGIMAINPDATPVWIQPLEV